MLKNAALGSKIWGTLLNENQVKSITDTLSSRKAKKLK
jgi:hypothetical protein